MKKTTNATFGVDQEELVQVALLQIHGGDGAYLSVLLGCLNGVSSVHFCLICSVMIDCFLWDTLKSKINLEFFLVLIRNWVPDADALLVRIVA